MVAVKSEVQFLKADKPISLKVLGSSTLTSSLIPIKALPGIFVSHPNSRPYSPSMGPAVVKPVFSNAFVRM